VFSNKFLRVFKQVRITYLRVFKQEKILNSLQRKALNRLNR